jgi:hypothetical protein
MGPAEKFAGPIVPEQALPRWQVAIQVLLPLRYLSGLQFRPATCGRGQVCYAIDISIHRLHIGHKVRNMSDAGYVLGDYLSNEARRLRQLMTLAELTPVQSGVMLHEFVRTVDSYWLNLATSKDGKVTDTIRDFGYYAVDGWPMMLPTLLAPLRSYDGGFPLVPSTPEKHSLTLSILSSIGQLHAVDKYVQLCRAGLVEITRPGFDFCVNAKTDRIGLEALDQDSYEWFRDVISKAQEFQRAKLQLEWEKVESLMEPMVFRYMGDYIGYTSTSKLDQFFNKDAFLYSAEKTFGWDSFPDSATFGGIKFGVYREAVHATVLLALKHVAFCSLLLRRHPEMNPRNITSPHIRRTDAAQDLVTGLGVSRRRALQLVEAMCVPPTISGDDSVPRNEIGPWPMYVPLGSDWLIRSIGGCLYNPFWFLTRNLRRLFPQDYDTATQGREEVFRKDLNRLFDSTRFRVSHKNINLPSSSRTATDLDAAVYDTQTDTLAVFQLKWLDPFGTSMKDRRNRASEFYDKSTKWIETVRSWFRGANHVPVATALRLPHEKRFERILFFVLGRTAGNFSGPTAPDPTAAWGSWYEFAKTASKSGCDLQLLFDSLSAKQAVHTAEVGTTLRVGGHRVHVKITHPPLDGIGR